MVVVGLVVVGLVVVGFIQLPQSFGQYILAFLTEQTNFGKYSQISRRFLQSVHEKKNCVF